MRAGLPILTSYSDFQATVKLVPSEERDDGTASSAPLLPLDHDGLVYGGTEVADWSGHGGVSGVIGAANTGMSSPKSTVRNRREAKCLRRWAAGGFGNPFGRRPFRPLTSNSCCRTCPCFRG